MQMKKTMKKVVDANPLDKDVAMLHSPTDRQQNLHTTNLAATGEARKKQKILGKVITER
jgi:hypothetical protein